jgi:hypothetical protein
MSVMIDEEGNMKQPPGVGETRLYGERMRKKVCSWTGL